MYQMAQEGALWASGVIRLGPHWCNSKITWANIIVAVMDVGTRIKYIGSPIAISSRLKIPQHLGLSIHIE